MRVFERVTVLPFGGASDNKQRNKECQRDRYHIHAHYIAYSKVTVVRMRDVMILIDELTPPTLYKPRRAGVDPPSLFELRRTGW